MVSNIPGSRVSSFPVVSRRRGWASRRGRDGGLLRHWRMLILIETVEHLSGRPVGETASPEDIVSNEYANHESGPATWSAVISIADATGYL